MKLVTDTIPEETQLLEDFNSQMDTLCHEMGHAFIEQVISQRVSDVPTLYQDVLKLSKDEQKKWFSAMDDELKSIQE